MDTEIIHTEATRKTIKALFSSSMVNSLCYIGAQGVNFLFQIWLLKHLGKSLFGQVGLAQVYALMVTFIAELGMPSYFIRKLHMKEHWFALWRRARLFRMVVITIISAAIMAVLYVSPSLHASHAFMLMAIPGLFFSAYNPAPLLLGQNRTWAAALGQPIIWCTYALVAIVALQFVPAPLQEYFLGASLSFGYVMQWAVLSLLVHWPRDEKGQETREEARSMVKQSLTIWFPGLFGAAYALLLTFFVEQLNWEMLPYFLLGTQVMQGISGINMQVQRLLLPVLLSDHRSIDAPSNLKNPVFRLFAWLIVSSIVAVLAFLFFSGARQVNPVLVKDTGYFCLMAADWTAAILGSFLITALIAQHREGFIFKMTVITFSTSMVIQCVLLLATHSLVWIMIVRVSTCLLQVGLQHYQAKIRVSQVSLVAIAAMLLAACVEYSQAQYLIAGGISMLAVLVLLGASLRLYLRLISSQSAGVMA